ncbi:MAG: RNA-binding protein [Candidatus Margulisbacteria bacterium]|nr:RNA-binding protein [Candidatus Margulisiibacteriota bacterium]
MVKTLYVGNLSWSAKEEGLRQAFEAHAPILSVRIITDRETGRSKGFGFVEVEDNDAPKVIKEMNGFQLEGRSLAVNEARPKTARE